MYWYSIVVNVCWVRVLSTSIGSLTVRLAGSIWCGCLYNWTKLMWVLVWWDYFDMGIGLVGLRSFWIHQMSKDGMLDKRFMAEHCIYWSGSKFWALRKTRCAYRAGLNDWVETCWGAISWVCKTGLALSTKVHIDGDIYRSRSIYCNWTYSKSKLNQARVYPDPISIQFEWNFPIKAASFQKNSSQKSEHCKVLFIAEHRL